MGHIMNGGKDAHLKMLRLERERRAREEKEKNKYYSTLAGEEKLEVEIATLTNTVKLAECDLRTPSLSSSIAIKNKLLYAQDALTKKKKELEDLRNASQASQKEDLKESENGIEI